jgi:hypothetical protein
VSPGHQDHDQPLGLLVEAEQVHVRHRLARKQLDVRDAELAGEGLPRRRHEGEQFLAIRRRLLHEAGRLRSDQGPEVSSMRSTAVHPP